MSSSILKQQHQQHDNTVSWSIVKNYISECWLQFYGPLFWILHLVLCNIELHKSKKHLLEDHYQICQTIIFEEKHSSKLNPISLETTKKENNDDPTHQTHHQTDIDDDNASSSSSSTTITNPSPKSSFKHSLKGHLKSIKQKAMKKSILRKSSKQSLIQQQEESLSSPSTSPLSSSLPNSPLSSSILFKNESTISLPSTSTTLLNEQEYGNSLNDSKQPVFIPSLDRRPSFSDSLLKSFGKKKKQPSSSIPFPMNLQSNHNYNNITTTPSSSSTISLGRRETAPELYTRAH
ncbi:unnamed protein product [Cunninghamella blakesleeana]